MVELASSADTVMSVFLVAVMVLGFVVLWAIWHFVFRRAPGLETANGSNPDSAWSWAASSAADTLQRWAARLIAGAKRAGTKAGKPPRSPPPKPTEALPGFRPYPKCQGSQG